MRSLPLFSGLLSGLLGLLFFSSCKKETSPISRSLAVYPRTEAEKEKAELHTEFSRILSQIYQDRAAFREVQAAIWSGYYEDERVLLKALLAPGSSPLYHRSAFTDLKTGAGHFKHQFDSCLFTAGYPRLTKHLAKAGYKAGEDWKDVAETSTTRVESATPNSMLLPNATRISAGSFDPDLGNEEEEPLAIYFPYSENYKPAFQNEEEEWLRATLVAADRDANEAPGLKPGDCAGTQCYQPVTVNDEYCETYVVHIAQSGGSPAAANPVVTQPPLNMVLLGSVRCTRQYDHLISFTGNGGGSEIRFVRADGYMQQNTNGQITSPQNVISVDFSRKDIRKNRWKEVNSIWDSNWEPDNPEQVFAIYEEDNEGSRTLSGKIEAKIKFLTIEPLNYSFTVKTKDDIIRQLGWKRGSFFAYNQGGLNNGCGLSNGFTIYDCNSAVAYTLPVRK